MPSYRQALLEQADPLAPSEIADLEDWLKALREDVDLFGATAEDEARMAAISDRIARERPEPSPT